MYDAVLLRERKQLLLVSHRELVSFLGYCRQNRLQRRHASSPQSFAIHQCSNCQSNPQHCSKPSVPKPTVKTAEIAIQTDPYSSQSQSQSQSQKNNVESQSVEPPTPQRLLKNASVAAPTSQRLQSAVQSVALSIDAQQQRRAITYSTPAKTSAAAVTPIISTPVPLSQNVDVSLTTLPPKEGTPTQLSMCRLRQSGKKLSESLLQNLQRTPSALLTSPHPQTDAAQLDKTLPIAHSGKRVSFRKSRKRTFSQLMASHDATTASEADDTIADASDALMQLNVSPPKPDSNCMQPPSKRHKSQHSTSFRSVEIQSRLTATQETRSTPLISTQPTLPTTQTLSTQPTVFPPTQSPNKDLKSANQNVNLSASYSIELIETPVDSPSPPSIQPQQRRERVHNKTSSRRRSGASRKATGANRVRSRLPKVSAQKCLVNNETPPLPPKPRRLPLKLSVSTKKPDLLDPKHKTAIEEKIGRLLQPFVTDHSSVDRNQSKSSQNPLNTSNSQTLPPPSLQFDIDPSSIPHRYPQFPATTQNTPVDDIREVLQFDGLSPKRGLSPIMNTNSMSEEDRAVRAHFGGSDDDSFIRQIIQNSTPMKDDQTSASRVSHRKKIRFGAEQMSLQNESTTDAISLRRASLGNRAKRRSSRNTFQLSSQQSSHNAAISKDKSVIDTTLVSRDEILKKFQSDVVVGLNIPIMNVETDESMNNDSHISAFGNTVFSNDGFSQIKSGDVDSDPRPFVTTIN